MLVFVLFFPNTPEKKNDAALDYVDEPYAQYDCSGVEIQLEPLPPRTKPTSSITNPVIPPPAKETVTKKTNPPQPKELTAKMFVGTPVEQIAKIDPNAAQQALDDPQKLREIELGKRLVVRPGKPTQTILDPEQIESAEENGFAHFKKQSPKLLQFLKKKKFQTPPFLEGPTAGTALQSWAYDRYRVLNNPQMKSTQQEYYQCFGEHLALASWWLSQKSAKERLAGMQLLGAAAYHIREHLKDEPFISEIATTLIVPNLQYGGNGNTGDGSQEQLWGSVLLSYARLKQDDLYINACKKLASIYPKDDFGDKARLHWARKLEERGDYPQAIQVLETINPEGRITGMPERITELKKKIAQKTVPKKKKQKPKKKRPKKNKPSQQKRK